jgi:hypothetical protein
MQDIARKISMGFFCCLLTSAMSPARAMEWTSSFEFTNKTVVFRGEGEVVHNDAEKLLMAVAVAIGPDGDPSLSGAFFDKAKRPEVWLNSGGGSVNGGSRLGYAIRALRFNTVVPAGAECHSACTMAFLGGVHRTIVGKLGIRAMSPAGDARPQPADVTARIGAHGSKT